MAEPRVEQDAAAEIAIEGKPRQPRPWYLVILGALPAKEAFVRLDAAFADEADDDETERRTQGHVIAACAVLDEWGVLVPDTLAVASFAWGLGHMLSGGTASALADWDTFEQDLKERFGSILTPMDAGGTPRSLTWRDLRAVSRELAEELALSPELWLVTPCAIRMMRESPPRAEILSSFLLPDLGRVLRDADRLPNAAAAYLGLRPPAQSWDAIADRVKLSGLLQPALFPLGRWPGPGLHPLTLLQQAAVNAIPPWRQTAVLVLTSMSRSPQPYQFGTVMRCQVVAGSASTSDRFARRLPFVRGRPFVPGKRGGAGSYKAASRRRRVMQAT